MDVSGPHGASGKAMKEESGSRLEEVGVGEVVLAGEGGPLWEDGQELAEFEGAQVPFEVEADRVGQGHRVSFRCGVGWCYRPGTAGWACRARGGGYLCGVGLRRAVRVPPVSGGSWTGCASPAAGVPRRLVSRSCRRLTVLCCSARSRSRAL